MKKFLVISVLMGLASLVVLPTIALAEETAPEYPTLEVKDTLGTIGNIVFYVLLSLAALMIIIGGIMFVTAAGSTEQTTKARNIMIYALIGIVIAALAKGRVALIESTLGIIGE